MRSILCLVDFSEASRRALAAAAAIARQFDSNLWALHVLRPVSSPGRIVPPWVSAAADESERKRILGKLRSFISDVRAGHRATSVAVRSGEPIREALRYARTLGADLIVAGASRTVRSPRRSGLMPERLSALGSIPLLLVADDAAAPDPGMHWLTHAVCAVDLSPASRAALNLGLRLVLEIEGSLTVLHVHDPRSEKSGDSPERLRLDARQLRMLVPPGVDRWCDIHYLVVEGRRAHEIAAVAARTAAHLIVIGNEPSRTGASSLASDLLRAGSTAVLIASASPRLQVPWPDWSDVSEPLGVA